MANKQDTTPRASLQAILQQDEDWAREMIRRTVQEVLEQELCQECSANFFGICGWGCFRIVFTEVHPPQSRSRCWIATH